MSHAEYRWLLVDDMVEIFNSHREDSFIPSERICVDESISRWYGLGGVWINIGLPIYIAIDRKPENGYIHVITFGVITMNKVCCAGSYFSSVSSAEDMMWIGIRFIGVGADFCKKKSYGISIEY